MSDRVKARLFIRELEGSGATEQELARLRGGCWMTEEWLLRRLTQAGKMAPALEERMLRRSRIQPGRPGEGPHQY